MTTIPLHLDYTIKSPEERLALVNQIIAEADNLTPSYLEILADYLVLCMDKEERKARKMLTDNRMTTINKRERSLEGLADQLETGEDGLYSLISEDKNVIFQPKIEITPKDLETIPFLRQLREAITDWENRLKHSSGRTAYIIKNALIEMRKEQYLIKQAYTRPIRFNKITRSSDTYIKLDDESYLDENNEIVVKGVSFMNPKVVSALLCNYSKLKEDSWDVFHGDTWYLMQAFDELCGRALADHPVYDKIVECKIDGLQNPAIQEILKAECGVAHTTEYISSLWRNKIPKLIAKTAEKDFLLWECKKRNIPMKKCSRCGKFKPAHPAFFSRNKTSKDSFYSICKDCRNGKKKS